MKSKILAISVATSLALGASAVYGATAGTGEPFVGFGLGYGAIQSGADKDSFIDPTYKVLGGFKEGGFAWQVNGGYLYNLSNSIAAGFQLAYSGYPETTLFNDEIAPTQRTSTKIKGGSIEIAALAKYHWTDNLYSTDKVGLAVAMQEVESKTGNSKTKETNTSAQPVVGMGLGYDIGNMMGAKGLSVHADFQYAFGHGTPYSKEEDIAKEFRNRSNYSILAGITYGFEM